MIMCVLCKTKEPCVCRFWLQALAPKVTTTLPNEVVIIAT